MRRLFLLAGIGLSLVSVWLASQVSPVSDWIGAARPPQADIVITETGCTSPTFTLAADREPTITVANTASVAMVFTIPNRALAVEVAPGSSVPLEIPRYLLGTYDFF
jgi:hypothetical protein